MRIAVEPSERLLTPGEMLPLQLALGETPEQLAAMLVNSDEYLTLHAGGNDSLLSALFSDALGRPIDAGALAHFEQELTAGATRAQIADEIFAGAEYRTDVVRDLDMLAVDRAPDSGGSTYFVDQLAFVQHATK